MKILVIAPFCSLPGEPYFNRFLYLSELLSKKHTVTLVTSRFRHFDKKQRHFPSTKTNFSIELIDEPGYSRNVSLDRIWSHSRFLANFKDWFLIEAQKSKFDLVYSAYPLIGTNIFLGKVKRFLGFRLVVDVQDVWPESFSAVLPFLKKIPDRLIPFSSRANAAYMAADALVAVSETYLSRARVSNSKCPSLVAYIGSDGQLCENVKASNLESGRIHFLYVGTLSYSYDIETVVRAFSILKNTSPNYCLHIAGGGPDEEKIKSIATDNVIFHGFLPYQEMLSLAKGVSFFINPIRQESKASITNKLSDYFLIGKPIINSQTNQEVIDLLDKFIHENYSSGDINSFLNAINRITQKNGLNYEFNNSLKKLFDRRISYQNIVNFIEKVGTDEKG